MILQAREIEFAYNGRPILQKASLEVAAGEVVAVLGCNGAGKSTFLKCLNRILPLGGGRILLEGRDLAGCSRREIARRVAYLPQRQEPDQLTVYESVMLGRRPHIAWAAGRRDHLAVARALEGLRLGQAAGRRLDQLSGGELQKVGLARSLAQEPALLLLDEPTSSLDLRNQLELADLIRVLVRRQGLAAVVAMHDLSLALRMADRLVLIKDGGIFADRPRDELTEDLIAEVYGVGVRLAAVEDRLAVVPLELKENMACQKPAG